MCTLSPTCVCPSRKTDSELGRPVVTFHCSGDVPIGGHTVCGFGRLAVPFSRGEGRHRKIDIVNAGALILRVKYN